jgi:colicin import membrane protein
VLLSLLIGGTVGGILGAVVAVPLVAAFTVVLERLQDRDVPVPIDPAALPDESEREELKATAPDSPGKPRRSAKKAATVAAKTAREDAERAAAEKAAAERAAEKAAAESAAAEKAAAEKAAAKA